MLNVVQKSLFQKQINNYVYDNIVRPRTYSVPAVLSTSPTTQYSLKKREWEQQRAIDSTGTPSLYLHDRFKKGGIINHRQPDSSMISKNLNADRYYIGPSSKLNYSTLRSNRFRFSIHIHNLIQLPRQPARDVPSVL